MTNELMTNDYIAELVLCRIHAGESTFTALCPIISGHLGIILHHLSLHRPSHQQLQPWLVLVGGYFPEVF